MTPAPLAAGPETDARIAEAMTEIDHEWTDCPVCPKCGFTEQDWWDGLDIDVGDGTEYPSECPECSTPYTVQVSVSTTFTTRLLAAVAADRETT